MIKTMKIKDLSHLKLLSNPLKLRLVQYFAEAPGTIGGAAEKLQEPITKLYRHVDALTDSGLLKVVSEQQKRGTIERTFQAVAERFEIDHSLFKGDDDGETGDATIRELLDTGVEEVMHALNHTTAVDEDQQDILLTRVRIQGSSSQITRWRRSLEQWLEEVTAEASIQSSEDADLEDAGALIAFYPIEKGR